MAEVPARPLIVELPPELAEALIEMGVAESANVLRSSSGDFLTVLIHGLAPASQVVTIARGATALAKAILRWRQASKDRDGDLTLTGPSGTRVLGAEDEPLDESKIAGAISEVDPDQTDS